MRGHRAGIREAHAFGWFQYKQAACGRSIPYIIHNEDPRES